MKNFAAYSKWPAAVILAGWGLCELLLPGYEPGPWFRIAGALFFFLPAVGIHLLRQWGRAVALGVCAFNFAQAIHGPFGPPSNVGRVTMIVTLGLVLMWLFLPEVRNQFSDRSRPA